MWIWWASLTGKTLRQRIHHWLQTANYSFCLQLPHVHLLSTYNYPVSSNVDVHEVTKWLTAAPKIARDTAPFYWTYLDCPQDGTNFLMWQPTARRATDFASDGYVWPTPEVFYQENVGNGLVRISRHWVILRARLWSLGLTLV